MRLGVNNMNKDEKIKKLLQEKYFNQDDNYNTILQKISNRKQVLVDKRRYILGIAASICIVVLGTTSFVFSRTKLNEDKGKLSTIKLMKSVTSEKDGDVLEKCSSLYYIDISIKEISNKGLSLRIKDRNDVPYIYPHSYEINKKEKSDEHIGTGKVYR